MSGATAVDVAIVVPNMRSDFLDIHDVVPSDEWLTVATNCLCTVWHRHAGGTLSPQDRNSLMLVIMLCRHVLTHGAPIPLGRDADEGDGSSPSAA